jgi:hypothetical protein
MVGEPPVGDRDPLGTAGGARGVDGVGEPVRFAGDAGGGRAAIAAASAARSTTVTPAANRSVYPVPVSARVAPASSSIVSIRTAGNAGSSGM